MLASLSTSLLRVLIFWYIVGVLVLFLGNPEWAEHGYAWLEYYPWVPTVPLKGIGSAFQVQLRLLTYWTVPMLGLGLAAGILSYGLALWFRKSQNLSRDARLLPRGEFWGVTVSPISLGVLPESTTPQLVGKKTVLPGHTCPPHALQVNLQPGPLLGVVNNMTVPERTLCEELLQLLSADPHHFAGAGHGVGLLDHTLNVVTEAALKCTAEFRLPVLAALAHDIGKLITFQPDGKGGWKRQGLHSREGARILVTLPAFQSLPDAHQDALILAVKYDHAPNKMPTLRGNPESSILAMRIVTALSQADRTATANEKDRNLVKLQPEDLLWQDFISFLRNAPVVQRGKKGASNQVNNPPDSPYLFIYEAPWREAALPRMPEEVAAALDLNRRDSGKLAKYTRILVDRLRKEELLVEEHEGQTVPESNPLWDIQSGTGEKAVVLRGIVVLHANALWKALNYRLATKSPFPVQILAPNAGSDGSVNQAPNAVRDQPYTPDVTDRLKVDMAVSDLSAFGISTSNVPWKTPETTPPVKAAGTPNLANNASTGATAPKQNQEHSAPTGNPRARARENFKTPLPASDQDAILGLSATPVPTGKHGAAEVRLQEVTPKSTENLDEPSSESSDTVAKALSLFKKLGVADVAPPADNPEDSGGRACAATAGHEALSPESQHGDPLTSEMAAGAHQEPTHEARETSLRCPTEADDLVPSQHDTADTSTKVAIEPNVAEAAPEPVQLSRAEKSVGIALADAAAIALYPRLALGEKYYTAESSAVKEGMKQPGGRYGGDDKSKNIGELTSAPMKRARRRT